MSAAKTLADLEKLNRLSQVDEPTTEDKIELCCMIMRYGQGDQHELGILATNAAINWDRSPQMLLEECREIWLSGYNPNKQNDTKIGSANDTDSDS